MTAYKALSYGRLSKDERADFRQQILANENVIGLRETAQAKVTRYTTREALVAETGLLTAPRGLSMTGAMASTRCMIKAASTVNTLTPEQDKAVRHLTGAEGFAVLIGEAGTGKSCTLKATHDVYEQAGKEVRGLAPTHSVVGQMRGDGFQQVNTVAAELKALENGRAGWTRNTVLIVDEAAMISTKNLAALAAGARAAGAKLILAGDDKQLASIERGGMFETLRQTHGAAVLKEVWRVPDKEQKAAFNKMHEGEFLQALQTFEKKGGIHWTDKQSDTLKHMAARYSADVKATPGKRRFMFAYKNDDVAALNRMARAIHKERGDLGADHTIETASGKIAFAAGDRVQFTGNGYGKAAQAAGLTNGRVGTIKAIHDKDGKATITVELDGPKPKPGPVRHWKYWDKDPSKVVPVLNKEPERPNNTVSFVVGENGQAGEFNAIKHGYAGTIYKGQGKTLDEVYVGHSAQWRSSASYVALTRHREAVHIFAARETVQNLEAMAAGMARADNKRAATTYSIDPRSGFGIIAADMNERQPVTGVTGRTVDASVPPAPRTKPKTKEDEFIVAMMQEARRSDRDRGGGRSR